MKAFFEQSEEYQDAEVWAAILVGGTDEGEGQHYPNCHRLRTPRPSSSCECDMEASAVLARATKRYDINRKNWEESAVQFCGNAEYYRGLVQRIGKLYDPQCYIADDGTRSQDVLCAKVPELVEKAFTPWRCDAHGKSTCHACMADAAAMPRKLAEALAGMRKDGQGLSHDQEETIRRGLGFAA